MESSSLPRGPSTKEKLASIVEGFEQFDHEMKVGTRVFLSFLFVFLFSLHDCLKPIYHSHSILLKQRKELDEQKIHELRLQMAQMEKELGAEVKRRCEVAKSLQSVCVCSSSFHRSSLFFLPFFMFFYALYSG